MKPLGQVRVCDFVTLSMKTAWDGVADSMVVGLGYRVFGFRVSGLGFRVQVSIHVGGSQWVAASWWLSAIPRILCSARVGPLGLRV